MDRKPLPMLRSRLIFEKSIGARRGGRMRTLNYVYVYTYLRAWPDRIIWRPDCVVFLGPLPVSVSGWVSPRDCQRTNGRRIVNRRRTAGHLGRLSSRCDRVRLAGIRSVSIPRLPQTQGALSGSHSSQGEPGPSGLNARAPCQPPFDDPVTRRIECLQLLLGDSISSARRVKPPGPTAPSGGGLFAGSQRRGVNPG